jgi:O-antigen ligase
MEIFSTALFALSLIAFLFFPPRPAQAPPFLKPILVFVAIAVIGILLGRAGVNDKLYDLGRMRFFLLYFMLFYVLSFYARGFPWLRVLVFITSLVAVYGTVQHFVAIDLFRPEGKKVLMYAIQDQKIGPLVVGTFNHHLTFSNVYLFFATIIGAIALCRFPRQKGLLVLSLWLFLLCVWTESRAAWSAIPVVLFLLAWGKGRRIAIFTLAGALILFAILYRADRGFHERFARTMFSNDDMYNLGPRQRLWAANLAMFREHPLLGVGWNNNERFAKEWVDRLYPEIKDNFYGHAHSDLLQILSTTGILGLLAYLWLWGQVFAATMKSMRESPRGSEPYWLALGLFAAFVGFQIQGVTQWNFGDAEVIHNVMFFWAVTAALRLAPLH